MFKDLAHVNVQRYSKRLLKQKMGVHKKMDLRLINVGFGNIVSANRIIAIVSPESAPIKRIIQDARETGRLIDATYGRRTRAVIITDSGHVLLSSVQPETVANRLHVKDIPQEESHEQ